VIRALRDKGERRPWRHAQRALGDTGGFRTNERLARAAAMIPGGKLYGSATANLLLDDPRWSRNLPGFFDGHLHGYLARVLAWVIQSMPHLQRIMCLGAEAWFLTCTVMGRSECAREFARFRDANLPVEGFVNGRSVIAYASFHPAARVSDDHFEAAFKALTRARIGNTSSVVPQSQGTTMRNSLARPPESHSDGWVDAPFPKASNLTEVRDSPIRAEMVTMLLSAGVSGVKWSDFEPLGWRDGFTAQKVDRALWYVAKNNGRQLQYQGSRGRGEYPSRWRISV